MAMVWLKDDDGVVDAVAHEGEQGSDDVQGDLLAREGQDPDDLPVFHERCEVIAEVYELPPFRCVGMVGDNEGLLFDTASEVVRNARGDERGEAENVDRPCCLWRW